MTIPARDTAKPQRPWRKAAGIWERLRIWYSGVLALSVLGWVTLSWPHFRGSVGSLLLWFAMFLVIANCCYCAAYGAELLVQAFVPERWWRKLRQLLWVLGLLLSLLAENYWIADEIYPYSGQGPALSNLVGAGTPSAHFATNMNLPAPLAVVGFLGAAAGLFLAGAAIMILWFARKPKMARRIAITIGGGAVIYFGLLIGFSAASHTRILAIGQEKYFCEIDCHLAYSVVGVTAQADGPSKEYLVALQTRFDENTISANRPKDAPLMPSPREVSVVDGNGHEYSPASIEGVGLMTPLRPGESYTTRLRFQIPKHATGLRLLVRTIPAWPDHVVIGDENSWLHKKTYFAL
jgi:hypothetical protein